jgi:predicted ATPase
MELVSALDRLVAAGLVFPQGVPPNATYLFKHALVQDAAYGTLLRDARRGLHARIAKTLEREFVDISEAQPELLARHCTEAGLIEKAVGLWGKAGQRSLERSALVEAIAQLTRALDQIAALPATPALRREQIKLQVALITPLIHVKGYAAPETADGAGCKWRSPDLRKLPSNRRTRMEAARAPAPRPEVSRVLEPCRSSLWKHFCSY